MPKFVIRCLPILLIGCTLGVIGCTENKPEPPIPIVQPSGPPETEAEKKVRTHAWWTREIAPERLKWLVGEIQNCPPGKTFVFDSIGHQNARITTSDIRDEVGVGPQTGVPNPAWVSVRGGGWSKERVLTELTKALDEAMERRQPKGK